MVGKPRIDSADVVRRFDAMAGDYGTLEPWYEHLYTTLHALLRVALAPPAGAAPGRALDAGCGTGWQAGVLAELGWEVHGLDLSPGLLAVARRRRPGVALALGDVQALPYPDGAFDAVACCGSTLSFVAAPARALGEIGRVLRPGGRLLLECEHKWSLDLAWSAVSSVTGDPLAYGLSPRDVWRQVARPLGEGSVVTYPGYGRLRLFTLAELGRMMAPSGLVPVRTWGVHALTNLIPSTVLHRARLPRVLAALYRGLCAMDDALRRLPASRAIANSLVVLARKPPGVSPGAGRRVG